MDRLDGLLAMRIARRRLLGAGLLGAGGLAAASTVPGAPVDLALPGGPSRRATSAAFLQKGAMIVQRARPPLLETPMAVFNSPILEGDVFTPNDRFFVRWHWSDFPTAIDVAGYRLNIRGHVARPLSLTLAELMTLPRVELAAVNQCSGNSRGLFQPRVPGAQWRHGAMGNARWTGVRLRDVLDRAGVKGGAVAVRCGGLDKPLVDGAPDFLKSIDLDHARDGEVMIAFAQNGVQLPLLNGFPLRLIVPGWYSTYWVKMLSDIEVLATPDVNYWMAKAYRIPTTPHADVPPGAKDFPTVPINRMTPRSWITSLPDGARVAHGPTVPFAGIAMGGSSGVARVDVSGDGRTWRPARLGPDGGRYGFRRFEAALPVARPGPAVLMARCTNTAGQTQPLAANWNPNGFMRDCVERTSIMLTGDAA